MVPIWRQARISITRDYCPGFLQPPLTSTGDDDVDAPTVENTSSCSDPPAEAAAVAMMRSVRVSLRHAAARRCAAGCKEVGTDRQAPCRPIAFGVDVVHRRCKLAMAPCLLCTTSNASVRPAFTLAAAGAACVGRGGQAEEVARQVHLLQIPTELLSFLLCYPCSSQSQYSTSP